MTAKVDLADLPPREFNAVALVGGNGYKERGDEIIIFSCPYCGHESKSGGFSVNMTTGFFNCLRCNTTGGWRKLMKDFGGGAPKGLHPSIAASVTRAARVLRGDGDSGQDGGSAPVPGVPVQDIERRLKDCEERLWKRATSALSWLIDVRKLDEKTLRDWRIGEDEGGRVVFPFFDPKSKEIRRLKFRNPVDKDDMSYWPSAAGQPIPLFGAHLLDADKGDDQPAVIVEGEIDALTLVSFGFDNVVAVPGASMWKSFHKHLFKKFKRVQVAVDYDEAGIRLAAEIAADIGTSKCSRIRFGDWKDVNDAVVKGSWSWDQVREAILAMNPGGVFHAKHLGFGVVGVREGTTTGWDRLDFLMKGLRPCELTVLTGNTGEGKTSWSLDLSMRLASAGKSVLFATLENDRDQIMSKVYAMAAGVPWSHMRGNDEFLDKAKGILGAIGLNFVARDNTNSLESVMAGMRAFNGIDVVVLDHLGYLARPQKDIREQMFDAMDRTVRTLSDFARELKCHIMLIAHQSTAGKKEPTMYSIKYGATIPQYADNVLVVSKMPPQGALMRSRVRLEKARFEEARAGKDAFVYFDYDGRRFSESTI